jgi:hypothetical protein
MKKVEEKKKEIIINQQRFFLNERAAKIAVGHLGGVEVVPLKVPKEVFTRTVPPEIKTVMTIEPPEIKIYPATKEEKKTRKPRKSKQG